MYRKVFQEYMGATEQPFSANEKERFLLYPCNFLLTNDMADSIIASAKANAEKNLLATYIVSSEYEKENIQNYWLIDFTELEQVTKEIGPVEYALFSEKGDWGVIFSYEGFALLGCTKKFALLLKKIQPSIDNQVVDFLIHWKEVEQERFIDTTWIPPLLSYLYGRQKSNHLMREVGSSFTKMISR